MPDQSYAASSDLLQQPIRAQADGAADLAQRYQAVRRATARLCEPLAAEDYVLQSMPDASPVKWHLAHTAWFFETFLLERELPTYRPFRADFRVLFNSYYEAVGPRWPRPARGMLSRPSIAEVLQYRAHVDEAMGRLVARNSRAQEIAAVTMLGIQHEQQHQELILTDLKHAWAASPLRPVYRPASSLGGDPPPCRWIACPEALTWIGHHGPEFTFDNESPRHRVFIHDFALASRLVTNGEYLSFMADGGYDRPELWLSDGWAARQAAGWTAPLYWEQADGNWSLFSLSGMRPVDPAEPVCHVSYYEADAFARWAGARLPTEAEWESAAGLATLDGHYQDAERYHPAAAPAAHDRGPVYQLYGDVWQWTASPYVGYPGYRPTPGALGEYNGKFMCNQMVLRGASCATPASHARRTYRNFFRPDARWQFSGLRLAKDNS